MKTRGMRRAAARLTLTDRVVNTVNYVLLLAILVIVLIPILYVVSNSVSDYKAIYAGRVWLWPINFTLASYELVFRLPDVWVGYGNTLLYVAVGTAINVFMTLFAAYPLSRKDFRARQPIMFLFAFTMFFGGGLIPTYILVRSLRMINTIWALVMPSAISAWNLIIVRTYFQSTVPDEILEATKLDGCGDFRFLFSIVIPLSGAIIAVITLFYAVGHWNSYMPPLIYLNDQSKYPLQLVLRRILLQNTVDSNQITTAANAVGRAASAVGDASLQQLRETIKYALIIVSSLPVLVMYPFVQKYFVKGVMIGSLKG